MKIKICIVFLVLIFVPCINGCTKGNSCYKNSKLRIKSLDIIRQGIDSENVIYAVHAAEALSLLGESDLIFRKFKRRINIEKDEKMRCCIARELVRAGFQEYENVLFEVLKDPKAIAYGHAAEGIYKVGIDTDNSVLENAIGFTSLQSDHLWIYAAMIKNGNNATDNLFDYLYCDNPIIAAVTALVLGDTDNLRTQDIEHILKVVSEATPFEKVLYYSSIVKLRPQMASDKLIDLSKSNDASVRAFAAYSLREFDDARTLEILYNMLDDNNEDVRIRAAQSLILSCKIRKSQTPSFN